MSSTLDKNDIASKIDKAFSLDKLEELRVYYLGKKGLLTTEMKSLSLLSVEEKKEKVTFADCGFNASTQVFAYME